MERYGFVRVAVATPRVQPGAVRDNADGIIELLRLGATEGCDLLVFPELCLTGYTCGDLFQQQVLLDQAIAELMRVAEASRTDAPSLVVVGLPLQIDNRLYNVAAILHHGHILGVVPKSFIPTYKEFYERRWFFPGLDAKSATVRLEDREVPFGADLLFCAGDVENLVVGIEICEDLWTPIPPSSWQSIAGATVIGNLSASPETAGKAEYRRQLVLNQSGRCMAAYAYAASGVTESTTDLVFGGHGIIAENGSLLAENARFRRDSRLLVADVDLDRLVADRLRMTTFTESVPVAHEFRRVGFLCGERTATGGLRREVIPHPFVPAPAGQLRERCEEIFETQIAGLAKRLESARPARVVLGISGGLDSTLAYLVTVKTCDRIGFPRRNILGITLPGFGTSQRTLSNAENLIGQMGTSFKKEDIRESCLGIFHAMGHSPFGIDCRGLSVDAFVERIVDLPEDHRQDLVFENVQARVRTLLLMSHGFVIGTGDMSELALGWCTYNGDHMSMYNPNVSVPKSLVRFLVRWAADHEFSGELATTLHSIADTEISPELLPISKDQRIQSTESTIGPYELHDFFLFHVLRYGARPKKILYLAENAKFDVPYPREELRRVLALFYRRFFNNQYKRSCIPDGPKVGSVTLSPRGDWRMPSDADAREWLADLES